MAYDQNSETITAAEKQEAIPIRRAIRIGKLERVIIEEDGLSLLKGNAMLPLIYPVLSFTPFESSHNYIIITA